MGEKMTNMIFNGLKKMFLERSKTTAQGKKVEW